jgi:hypothetical protein
MPKIGRFVTDPRVGAYCHVTLDSGEKIVVNHDKGGVKGGLLTIEVSKFMGISTRCVARAVRGGLVIPGRQSRR